MVILKNIEKKGITTKCLHSSLHDEQFRSLNFPIYASSTFRFNDTDQVREVFETKNGYIYSRGKNPTVDLVAKKIALLEGTEDCFMTSSGMGAINTAVFTAVKSGDHIVSSNTLYGCTYSFFISHLKERYDVEVTLVDFDDMDAVEKAIQPNTKLIYAETLANPTIKPVDLKKMAEIGKKHNILTMIDNTVASAYNCNPAKFGIDVIVHSATKYLNGHGDVVAGAICSTKEFCAKAGFEIQKDVTGACLSSQDAYLINRGLKTYQLRCEQHNHNALEVAKFLDSHPAIKKVYYPGLENNEYHELAKKQMNGGYSGLLACELVGGYDAANTLVNNLEVFTLAVSLGDCESLIEHPASMTHFDMDDDALAEAGIAKGLIRLSIGIENTQDIIDDLKEQLDKLV
ncbi:MAG: PLP-dependent aspartate aminotransferase family protein [Bacilli bacterium]|nr:PLP-dependent aspartate aminotransferase family protein [Bacilli bacterium]